MGFAAMWIFIYHVRDEALLFFHVPGLQRVEIFFNNIGFCGVDIFLFLSGGGLYHAIKKHSLTDFFKRRYRRLIPPFVLVCVFKALVDKWSIMKFVKAVTGWSFITEYIHVPIWFIPAIALVYLFFPLYYKAFEKYPNKYFFTGITFVMWYALSYASLQIIFNRNDAFIFVNRIPIFMAGVLFGWMTFTGKKIPEKPFRIVIFIVLIIGLQLQFYCTFRKLKFLFPVSNDGLPAFLIGITMCFAAANFFKLLNKVTVIQKAFGFLGAMTLEFYAAQEIVLNIMMNVNANVLLEKHLYAFLVFLFSLGGGYLMHVLMTMFFNKMDGKPVFTDKKAK